MSSKDSTIIHATFFDIPDVVTARIQETLDTIMAETVEVRRPPDLTSQNASSRNPPLRLIKGNSVEELVDDELFLMMLLWMRNKDTRCSSNELRELLRQRDKSIVYYEKIVIPRLIRKGFLARRIIDDQSCYELVIAYASYARMRFLSTLETEMGQRSFLGYTSMLYDGKMIDDDDLEGLYWWIAAIRGYLDGDA